MSVAALEIVRAQPEDAAALTAIARAAKAHWGYPERWLELWRPQLTITPEAIADRDVYMLVGDHLGDRAPLGFYVLAGESPTLILEDLWVAPAAIGHGFGRRLLAHAMARAAIRGARRLALEADPNAEGFYLRMGARRVGERTGEVDGQPRSLPLMEIDLD